MIAVTEEVPRQIIFIDERQSDRKAFGAIRHLNETDLDNATSLYLVLHLDPLGTPLPTLLGRNQHRLLILLHPVG